MIEFYHNDCHRTAGTLEKLKDVMQELGISNSELRVVNGTDNPSEAKEQSCCCPSILVNGYDIVTGQKLGEQPVPCKIHQFGGESCVTVPENYLRIALSKYMYS